MLDSVIGKLFQVCLEQLDYVVLLFFKSIHYLQRELEKCIKLPLEQLLITFGLYFFKGKFYET